jgi:hypothetical protein
MRIRRSRRRKRRRSWIMACHNGIDQKEIQ